MRHAGSHCWALALLAATLALAGCVQPTYFRHPISPPGEARIDERLIGSWVAQIDGEVVYQLVIEPHDAEGQPPMLSIAGLAFGLTDDAEEGVGMLWFARTAHASVIGANTYYNVRVPETSRGTRTALLVESGVREFDEDETEWVKTPEHAYREYWIVKPTITEEGLLWLHAIALDPQGYLGSEEDWARLLERLRVHGHRDSYWMESCGEFCEYARADLGPGSLAPLIRDFPDEALFNWSAGPFAQLDSALPEFDYPGKWN